jgi:DNA mismatch repair protein MutH
LDLLALIIASFTLTAVVGALVVGAVLYLSWGWLGAVLGAVLGYAAGVWCEQRFAGVPLSPYAKGWVSLGLFIGGLTVLAIATR